MATNNNKATGSRLRTGIFGCLTVFLCSLCLIGFAVSRTDSSSETRNDRQATSTVVTILDTNTPEPTQTPRPTNTPEAEDDEYFVSMQEALLDYYTAHQRVVEYMEEAGNDPAVIFDSDWKTELGIALGILNFRANEMAKLEPSPKFETFHAYIVELAEETNLFTTAYAAGVDNFEASKIEEASGHLQRMSEIMNQATAELERLKNQ